MIRHVALAIAALAALAALPSDARAACLDLCSGNGVCIEDTCLCDPGWAGEACQIQEASCPKDCSGNGVCSFGKCFCSEGYTGDDCSQAVELCPGGCGPYGTCILDQCECKLGWTGPKCDVAVVSCPGDCSGRGVCLDDGTCACDAGYSGDDCGVAVAVCPNECSGKGVCKAGQCFCEPGFSGEDCSLEANTCPNECSGKGVCKAGQCFCEAGFSGEDCSIDAKTCPNECSGKGVCLSGACACLAGYSGPDCSVEAKTCPNDCSGKGVCLAGTCACLPGFGGVDCSGECTLQCSGRGACQGGTCFCDPGFEGEGCEKEATCPNGCSGKGVCALGKCFCQPGFWGLDCSESLACPKDCSGRGICQAGKCFCEPGFDGETCEKEATCPEDCSGKGVCQYGKCFCEAGYEGGACEKKSPPCDLCSERGICLFGGQKCLCDPGFEGANCEKEKACPKGCSGNGVCAYGHCFCKAGYSGPDCGTRDGLVLETTRLTNPTYEAGAIDATSVLYEGVDAELVIVLTDPATGEELQATRHPLPSGLVTNGVVVSRGFGGGLTLVTSVQYPFQLRYGLAIESPDPTDPGVVLFDFEVPALTTFLPEETAAAAADLLEAAEKSSKAAFAEGREIAERNAQLFELCGLSEMDAGVFAEGSWATAAERALLDEGFDGTCPSARVVSPGAPVRVKEECWDVFTASLPPSCGAEGLAFGDFKSLPKECRPDKRLVFSYQEGKDPAPGTVQAFGIIGNCGFRQDERGGLCGATNHFRAAEGGGFVFGTTTYFEVRALPGGAGTGGPGSWPPGAAAGSSITYGMLLGDGGQPIVEQVARELAEGEPSPLDALGLPAAEPPLAATALAPSTWTGGTWSGTGTVYLKDRPRKGGFVVIVDEIPEPKQPSDNGGSGTGSWLGGYEIP